MDIKNTEENINKKDAKTTFHGRLTFRTINFLYFYFGFFLLISILGSIYVIIVNNMNTSSLNILIDSKNNTLNQYNLATIGSIFCSLMGNSIYYVRKLYKLSLSKSFVFKISTINDKIENIGTLFYFIFRPLFAIAFSILTLISIKTGIITLSGEATKIVSSFTDLSMFLSFFVGFSTGSFLNKLDIKSEFILNKFITKETID